MRIYYWVEFALTFFRGKECKFVSYYKNNNVDDYDDIVGDFSIGKYYDVLVFKENYVFRKYKNFIKKKTKTSYRRV